MRNRIGKLVIIVVIALLLILVKKYELANFLTLDYLKENQSALLKYYHHNKVQTIASYMIIYILSVALSIPGAVILTLAGGALFGLVTGTIIVSFSSTIGATLAFIVARFLLRDYIQSKFSSKLEIVNKGIKNDGAFYLFTLRLIPAFPFFLINLVMGLTPIKTLTFFFVSQIGMLLGTIVYVNAGVQLSRIESLKGILSPTLILSFTLLAILPFLAKKIIRLLKV